MAAAFHSDIYQHCGNNGSKTPWKHQPESVAENKEMKVLWDIEIRIDKVIPESRQDIVVIEKARRTTAIIDMAVSLDWKVRHRKCEDLEISRPQNRHTETMECKSESCASHSGINGRNFNEHRETY